MKRQGRKRRRKRQSPDRDSPAKSSKSCFRLVGGVALALFLVGLVVAVLLDRSDSALAPPPIPTPDTTGMQPRVAQQILGARELVVKQPRSADAWGRLGEICHTHALFDEAATCYRQAGTLEPNKFQWAYLLAIARRDESATAKEVIVLFEEAIKRRSDYAPAHYRLGVLHGEQGDASTAQAAFAEALKLDPDLLIARRALGQLLLATGALRESARHLEMVLRRVPNDGPTKSGLIQAYMRLGLSARAEELASEVTNFKNRLGLRDPVWEGIFAWNVQSGTARRKALGFIGRKEYREAIGLLKQVEEVDPDDPYINLFLAMAYIETDQIGAAEKHFDRMMELRNEMFQAQLVLTLEHLDDGVRRYLSTLVRVSMAADRRQQLEHAQSTMENQEGTDSLLASLHSEWGNALVSRNDLAGSVFHYKQVTLLEPESPSAFTMLGQIMEVNGREEEAMGYYQRAVELDPSGVAAQKLQDLRARRP